MSRGHRSVMNEPRASARAAFTLIELMVAMGILAGMMTMIGMVFSSASKASGQAQATAALYRQLRQATSALRHDLNKIQPLTSTLGIAGVEVSAQDKADSPIVTHRADLLMLVGDLNEEPFIFQDVEGTVTVAGAQIVYGHADLDDFNSATGWASQRRRVETPLGPPLFPASQWHLARRAVVFPVSNQPTSRGTSNWPLTNPSLLGASNTPADLFQTNFAAVRGAVPGGLYKYDDDDDNGGSELELYYAYVPQSGSGFAFRYERAGNPHYLYENGYWYEWTGPPLLPETSPWSRQDPPGTLRYSSVEPDRPTWDWFNSGSANADRWYLPNWFYNPALTDRRTVLDPKPPVGAADRMSAHFLPNCSEFKVEFTYDDPRELLIPGGDVPVSDWDEDNSYESTSPLPIRWQSVPDGKVWVWKGMSVNPLIRTDPNRWPKALKITIRVYDAGDRLEKPIEQTIIHTW